MAYNLGIIADNENNKIKPLIVTNSGNKVIYAQFAPFLHADTWIGPSDGNAFSLEGVPFYGVERHSNLTISTVDDGVAYLESQNYHAFQLFNDITESISEGKKITLDDGNNLIGGYVGREVFVSAVQTSHHNVEWSLNIYDPSDSSYDKEKFGLRTTTGQSDNFFDFSIGSNNINFRDPSLLHSASITFVRNVFDFKSDTTMTIDDTITNGVAYLAINIQDNSGNSKTGFKKIDYYNWRWTDASGRFKKFKSFRVFNLNTQN